MVKKLTREEQKEIRREEILEAANDLFITKGLGETRMSDVANKVNMNVRTVYRYFPTKEILAFEIETSVIKEISKSLEGIELKGRNGLEKVREGVYNFYNALDEKHIRYIGEFDYYFKGAYPDNAAASAFVTFMQKSPSSLLQYFYEGMEDGSIRKDIDPLLVIGTLGNALIALQKRVVLRGEHLDIEQGITSKDLPMCLIQLMVDGLAAK